MQKTNKELAEFYGIKVGDVVKIYDQSGISDYDLTFNVVLRDGIKLIRTDLRRGTKFDPWILADRRYEVIEPKKKVGETKCGDYDKCSNCPLYYLHGCKDGSTDGNETLYDLINTAFYMKTGNKTYADHPIYKAFKAELDKEVE